MCVCVCHSFIHSFLISHKQLFSYCHREEDSECEKHKRIWYYSTKVQLAELTECLDKDYWEADICKTLEEMHEEIHRHMDITEDLTNKARGSNKSFLAAANGRNQLILTF